MARQVAASNPLPLWYDPAATTHNFGLVLAGTDVSRSHTFRVINRSNQPVVIRGVVNRKPCCGDLESVSPTTLGRGEAVSVPVRIKLGLGSGHVVHAAAIQVEGANEEVILSTMATAQARATIDEIDPTVHRLAPGESSRAVFLIESVGTAADPPRSLDDSAVRCSAPTEWVEPAEAATVDESSGLLVLRRKIAVLLSGDGEPGRRTAELLVRGGAESVLGRRQVEWEVAAALIASPVGLILHSDRCAETPAQVVIRSFDRRPFRILEATTDLAVLSIVTDSEAQAMHTLRCVCQPAEPGPTRTGRVTVRTDRPAQSTFSIAVYIAAATGDAPISTLIGNKP